MKKCIALLLVLSLAAAVLAGCSKKPVLPEEDVKVAVLKGPTAIAMVNLMSKSDKGEAGLKYSFQIAGAADEITADLIKGNIKIAAVPANLASVLYNKTEGGIKVAAINNLGVLYVVELGNEINSVADLKGKTIYSTGKGATPEYTLRYLLTMAGIDPDNDVTIEFKSEATEVAALMSAAGEGENVIAMLPQPYVTAVTTQNERARVALDVNTEWNALAGADSAIVTGVIVVNKDFAESYPDAVKVFIDEFKASADTANSDIEGTAALLESYDIFKAAIAKKAIPFCNIVNYTGDEMKKNVEAYLQVLFDQNPASVGGKLPAEDFYLYVK
ncbi:MAG: ABC transporter substrate-binding protein [Lachnospiraceae bacterium]|nr:ABC transporter substrate-binding protein [Lachnospiraceae bacterium]